MPSAVQAHVNLLSGRCISPQIGKYIIVHFPSVARVVSDVIGIIWIRPNCPALVADGWILSGAMKNIPVDLPVVISEISHSLDNGGLPTRAIRGAFDSAIKEEVISYYDSFRIPMSAHVALLGAPVECAFLNEPVILIRP